ncbi:MULTISPECIES: N-acetylmuramic acid 6-phosphate etherase [unclassified Meiothermus]|uniref:N-acetylmuramic acid 6-phosphate etherase n=1 Tax=unclassified Meiothermus TaxID=370471 RepID=UPI000D7D05F1|nr:MULTISPECIES: N-acetylmuramic acid 6-phosphate etherase [unclassified Meiothermus]PZA06753.1 N-acetylmuramic acid 6-phosphate etherase [Meiothermus sp. Pnk-1]RYM37662.1 N-acetylmuramic acid 6-phosphate etherase [Meiothermus sp. PNK-Is4]
MNTEVSSPRYKDLDTWQPGEILEALLERQFAAIAAVRAARASLEAAALAAATRLRQGGRLAYAGAGTSGRLAVQDGAELPPTYGWPQERLVYLLAGGPEALLHPVEGAEDDEAAGREAASRLTQEDVLVGVAASGRTPYTVAALREARARGVLTIGIANNPDTPLLQEAQHPIFLDTGPEVVAGSTRMAAGTAQKAALNLLSTLTMIRLGRVYGNRMVEVTLTNQKLWNRALRTLQELTGSERERAEAALEAAGGRVSLAVLLLRGLGLEEALALLAETGSLRAALERRG